MQIIDIKYKANYYSLLLLSFILPLYKHLIPFGIALFVLTSFINHRKNLQFKSDKRGKIFWLTTIFIICFISVLYGVEKPLAWLNIETKLSLIAFPIAFFFSNIDFKKVLPSILKSFIEGCLIASVLVITQALLQYSHSGDTNNLLYSKLSFFHHASYFAMYLCFALVIIYNYSFAPSKQFYIKPIYSFILLVFFSFMITLLSSKTGWLVLFIIHFFALGFWIIKHKHYFKGVIALITIFIGTFLFYNYSPSIKNRVDELSHSIIDNNDSDESSSTQARIIIWKITIDLIKENAIIGYGCGSSKEILTKKYKEHNLKLLMNKKLNAHNQYLQTTLDTGIIGGTILLLTLFIPLFISIKRKQFLFTFFIGIIILNFLTEAMLETQSGVVFYAFFNTLFFGVLMQQNQENQVKTTNQSN